MVLLPCKLKAKKNVWLASLFLSNWRRELFTCGLKLIYGLITASYQMTTAPFLMLSKQCSSNPTRSHLLPFSNLLKTIS